MEQTKLETICQSCGMPMVATEHFGTKSDNSPSADYCCYCFQSGHFTHDMSMEDAIESNVSYMDGSEKIDGRTLTKSEAALRMHVQLPSLKRWSAHESIHKEYFKAINRAVDYINEHLNQPVNLYDLANIVNISEFHFHRIFKALVGESPGEYIQRLRLEKAIFKLQTTKLTLTEIAEQIGYQSPHALSKAFKKRFGTSPSVFRAQPSDLSFPINEPEFLLIEPEIKEINPKKVMTFQIANPFENKDAFVHGWRKLVQFMNVTGIPDATHEYISLSRDVSTITESSKCRTYVCISSNPNIKPEGEFGQQIIAGGLYAVFTYREHTKTLSQSIALYTVTGFPIVNTNYEMLLFLRNI